MRHASDVHTCHSTSALGAALPLPVRLHAPPELLLASPVLAFRILGQTCLVTQELFPANVGRIHALLKSHPLFHRLPHHPSATSPPFAQQRIDRAPPLDKGSLPRGVVQR